MFIHLSVGGLLGCFYLLAVVINGAVSTGVQVSVSIPAFSPCGCGRPGGELLDHKAALSVSEEVLNYFPQRLHHFMFSPAMHECSNFSLSSPTLAVFHFVVLVLVFDGSYSNGYGVVSHCSHCGFDLHFYNG